MRLQIVVKSARLEQHFQAVRAGGGNTSAEGERLMLLGLAAGSIEEVVQAAILDGLRDAQIVVATGGPAAAQSGEDAQAAEALAAASGGWFDDD